MIKKIISGGQTGVDRAALDIALTLKIPHGGWCPKGRKAEGDTIIPDDYLLTETPSSDYSQRTKFNIRDSDGTLILLPELPMASCITDGTVLTIQEVKRQKKPYLILDLSKNPETLLLKTLKKWLVQNKIKILNIAGPRESQSPGMFKLALDYLDKILKFNI